MSALARRTGAFGILRGLVLGAGVALIAGLAALILAYRSIDPISTLMLARWAEDEAVVRDYVPLERIAHDLRVAVIVSEDAQFCRHDGVDWAALQEVMDEADADGPSRGASTITMQTVKNLFLWPSRSVIRKALEIPLALVVDFAWPKRRILEIYLNIAEWGEGVFGAEAAARLYFHKSAAALDPREAALLATALPNPLRRNPARPGRGHAALADKVAARVRASGALINCVR